MSEPHPHDLEAAPVPDRLPAADLRALSVLEPGRALRAIATEWSIIAAAIALGLWAHHPLVTVLAVIVIGARQHALLVIAHDAAHFRLLPGRVANDWVGNLLLSWPMFVSVQGFRHFHGPHHKFLAAPGDGNRALWSTHDGEGQLAPEWRYPKSTWGFVRKILWRASGPTGAFWILRGVVGGFQFGVSPLGKLARLAFAGAVAALLTWAEAWGAFALYWVLPYCTWHVAAQYIRLACEHSAIPSTAPGYELTRTTLPTRLEGFFLLPRHVGYHIEHHWYPSVPFYRLPDLHARLCQQAGFSAHAPISRSLRRSVRALLGPGFEASEAAQASASAATQGRTT